MLVKDCPHVYLAGNQPSFEHRVITGPADQQVVLLSIPKFSQTGTIVLLEMETLAVETVQIDVVEPGS
jgi:DNA polymerase delta subunit 2